MGLPRRVATSACALAVGTAVLTPVLGSEPAQAGPVNADPAAAKQPAAVVKAGGFHSKSGTLNCRKKGETAWIWDSAAGASRVSWKPKGGHLVSRVWRHTPDGISTRTVPTWRKSVKWKVTSTYGNGKNLSKVYGYCSTQGWRVGKASDKLSQKKSGTKRCPGGKTVYISSGGIGNMKHRFKSTSGGALHTHNFGGSQQVLVTDRATPTEMRSVKWRVEAWSIKHSIPNAKTGTVKLSCISKY
ncbi:hypothetical protein [Streptomyces decoyicus]|uniref:hypothetical protein n=1 Tax=Streptomyces decoyicus TaxID=249567 RepID=UPI000AEDE4F9|nr:hypothetical protein [Streptomyces decoyicus]QZY17736.1 hypothetical protein K7C20_22875 [Streptomyces decoyicus]